MSFIHDSNELMISDLIVRESCYIGTFFLEMKLDDSTKYCISCRNAISFSAEHAHPSVTP
jgi:hypothetical protein